jgi:hypothetical protein
MRAPRGCDPAPAPTNALIKAIIPYLTGQEEGVIYRPMSPNSSMDCVLARERADDGYPVRGASQHHCAEVRNRKSLAIRNAFSV